MSMSELNVKVQPCIWWDLWGVCDVGKMGFQERWDLESQRLWGQGEEGSCGEAGSRTMWMKVCECKSA